MTTAMWLAPVLVPILAGALAFMLRGSARWLLVLAPLPALLLGVFGPPGSSAELGWVLLDAEVGLEAGTRPLLVMTAVVWVAAGASARQPVSERAAFAPLFLLALAGNVGVLLATDVVTFYAMFAWMTFAAYGLVVHDRRASSRRAGRVYVVLAVFGEVCLLGGLVLAASHAGTTDMGAVSAALPDVPGQGPVLVLLVVGFGVKVGIVPLHVWLPLAHPAAPVAASAVLSGTMIKAGLVGWLRVLPLGEVALPGWGGTLIGVGLAGAVLGVVAGTLQSDVKVLLAYSSVSQMGLLTTAVGVGLAVPGAAELATAAALAHAVHHGLAKAALFLAVGIHKTGTSTVVHRVLLAGTILSALALAGAPLTSGWVAKQVLKDTVGRLPAVPGESLTLALSLAAAGTTVLMIRLLWLVREPVRPTSGPAPPGTPWTLVVPWALATTGVAVGGWLSPRAIPPAPQVMPVDASGLWDGLWPVLLGSGLAAARARYRRRRPSVASASWPTVPAGDVLVIVERMRPLVGRPSAKALDRLHALERRLRTYQDLARVGVRPGIRVDRIESWLTGWRTGGVLFAVVGAAITFALAVGAG